MGFLFITKSHEVQKLDFISLSILKNQLTKITFCYTNSQIKLSY